MYGCSYFDSDSALPAEEYAALRILPALVVPLFNFSLGFLFFLKLLPQEPPALLEKCPSSIKLEPKLVTKAVCRAEWAFCSTEGPGLTKQGLAEVLSENTI